jgi:hypothetical protein
MNTSTSVPAGRLKIKKTLLNLYLMGAALLLVMILLFDNQSPEGIAAMGNDPWMLYLEEGFCRCILF